VSRVCVEAAAWALIACLIASGAAARPSPLRRLPICTVVAVETVTAVNSATARAGDFFRFQTVNAVTDGDTIVIPSYTPGWGIVVVAARAGRNGQSGSLVLEPLYLVLSTGARFGVVLDHAASNLQANGKSSALPAYLGAIPVIGVGAAVGAFNYFHRGKDITVPKGTMFAVFPSNDASVAKCQKR